MLLGADRSIPSIEIWDSAKFEAYEQSAIENFDKNAEEI